jgi:hypothetical protein
MPFDRTRVLSPANQYWHDGRQDNFLTATAEGRRDASQAGYRFVRVEGWIFIANSRHAPARVFLYWNPRVSDNYTTAETEILGAWRMVRQEGFAPVQAGTGTPVQRYWNFARGDTFTTATAEGVASAQQAGYTLRVEDPWSVLPPNLMSPPQLKLFWNAARQDYMTTATDTSTFAAAHAGYQSMPDDAGEPLVETTQLPNTVPLELYWSDNRQDNFTTATDQGRKDAAAGYAFVRREGYVWPRRDLAPLPVVPLAQYWHPGRGDNFLAAGDRAAEVAREEGYTYIRDEGYITARIT